MGPVEVLQALGLGLLVQGRVLRGCESYMSGPGIEEASNSGRVNPGHVRALWYFIGISDVMFGSG